MSTKASKRKYDITVEERNGKRTWTSPELVFVGTEGCLSLKGEKDAIVACVSPLCDGLSCYFAMPKKAASYWLEVSESRCPEAVPFTYIDSCFVAVGGKKSVVITMAAEDMLLQADIEKALIYLRHNAKLPYFPPDIPDTPPDCDYFGKYYRIHG